MEIVGTIVRVELEGGFWGIEDDAGLKFDPGELSVALRKEGLRVRVEAVRSSRMSLRMWGRAIDVVAIRALDSDDGDES